MTGLDRGIRGFLLAFLMLSAASAAFAMAEEWSTSPSRVAEALAMADDGERIQKAFARSERRAQLEPGSQWALYQDLLKHVPPGGEVNFVSARHVKGALAFSNLKVLLYPRVFRPHQGLAPNWEEGLKPDPKLYLLEYAIPYMEPFSRAFEKVAEGSDYRLWRCRVAE